MQRERIRKIIGCFIAICALTGCGDKKANHTAFSLQVPEHVKEESEPYFTVDAEVTANQPEELYSYRAVYEMPDGDKLKEVFMPEEEECVTEYDADFDRYICNSKDEKKRASTAMGTTFRNTEYSYYYALLVTSDQYHMFPESFPVIKTVEELPFADREKAAGSVRETAEKLDIRLAEEPFVFEGVDAEGLLGLYQKEIEVVGEEGMQKNHLSDFEVQPDMGCYYMLWRVLAPHGEIFRNGNMDIGGKMGMDGAYVMAIYSPGGMTSFMVNAVFAYEEEERVSQLLSVDEALKQVEELYGNAILTEKDAITITEIALEYVPVQRDMEKKIYDILPAWCMYGTSGGGDFPFFVMVDAQTGDIL